MGGRFGWRVRSLLGGLVVLTLAGGAGATPGVTSRRLAGDDRFATARSIATATFTRAPVTLLATAAAFPDALAAAYLAGFDRGPVLLAGSGDAVPAEVVGALADLGTRGVQLIGGPSALGEGIRNDLAGRGFVVERLAGDSRLATAAAIARAAPPSAVGTFPGRGRTAIVARGDDFPDALVGGPLSYARAFPILLTDRDALSPETEAALGFLGIRHVLLLGGPAAVSEGVRARIEALGVVVRRVAGGDRAATAVAVADLALDELGFRSEHVNLARGDTFPDALVGAAHGGEELAPILLANDPDSLASATIAFLNRRQATVGSLDVFGGSGALSDATVAAARRAAGGS